MNEGDVKLNIESLLLNDKQSIKSNMDEKSFVSAFGIVKSIKGLTIEVEGLNLPVGSVCRIMVDKNTYIDAEVIGFSNNLITIMPYESVEGISKGMMVEKRISDDCIPTGRGLLGRVLDPFGRPYDDKGSLCDVSYSKIKQQKINPLSRKRITSIMDVGIRAINCLITICMGQRMGIFAESGIGKSVLLGMMTQFSSADIVVVGLIGERGREVKEFIEEILGEETLKKAVIITAPADSSPLMKAKAATYTTAIAESYRDEGLNVLLIMDSLTRYGQALREIALSAGEMPTSKGYSPSVFSKISGLVERSGNGNEKQGSITAIYTVLTEAENLNDPLADHVRSLIDGHIVLSRKLAESGHYPAIDIDKSVSRLMPQLVDTDRYKKAMYFRQVLSSYNNNLDMINIGMYAPGSDRYTDIALKNMSSIKQFLCQGMKEQASMTDSHSLFDALLAKMVVE